MPIVSTLKELLASELDYPQRPNRVKTITFVWVVKQTAELTWFIRDLCHLQRNAAIAGITVHLEFYITREDYMPSSLPEIMDEPAKLNVQTGRPNPRAILSEFYQRNFDGKSAHDVVGVHVCGPDSLSFAVLTACSTLSNHRVTFMGGKESFEL